MIPNQENDLFVIHDPSGDIKVAEPMNANQLNTDKVPMPTLKPGEVRHLSELSKVL